MSKLLKNTKSTRREAQVLMAVVALSGIISMVALSPQVADAFATTQAALDRTMPAVLTDPALQD